MRCVGPFALAEVVDKFDSAHEFLVAGLVVMLVSCAWGSFTEWQSNQTASKEQQKADLSEKAALEEAKTEASTPNPHAMRWSTNESAASASPQVYRSSKVKE